MKIYGYFSGKKCKKCGKPASVKIISEGGYPQKIKYLCMVCDMK